MTVRKRKWLRVALWLAVVAWMGVIFAFSAEVATDSEQTSGRIVRWLLVHLDKSFPALSAEEQLLRVGEWSFAVRKLAHFSLFAVMGLLSFAAFSVDLPLRRAFPAALGLGTARGVLDEVQQAFVPGRSCELRDMCIDAAGVLIGASFLFLILHLIQRKKLKG